MFALWVGPFVELILLSELVPGKCRLQSHFPFLRSLLLCFFFSMEFLILVMFFFFGDRYGMRRVAREQEQWKDID